MTDALPATDKPAQFSSRYRVVREIGRGGMAIVYLADDLRHGRQVALKVLRPELAASLGGDRFRREIRIAASLTHPNILPLHDSSIEGEPLFYAMPYVDGETLRQRLARGPLPTKEAVNIALEMSEALEQAHRKGIVHRDVKPENVLLIEGHAVVSDFGIAHAVREAGAERLTGTGVMIGTPMYMSPEQVDGQVDIDGRSDVFSAGVVLYEMIAGAPPFAGSSISGTLSRIVTASPPPLIEKRPDVPPELDSVVQRALEKNPAERYQSARELADALRQMKSYPSPSRRGPVIAAGIALGALAILLVFVMTRRPAVSANALPSIAVIPFATESNDTSVAYFGMGIADELLTALADVPGLRVASRSSSFGLPPQADARQIASRLGVTNVLEGSVRRSGTRVRVTARLVDAQRDSSLWSESFDRGLADVFEVQEEIARAIVERLRVRMAAAGAIVRRRTESAEAHDLVLRATGLGAPQNASEARRAEQLVSRAIQLDSSYADAWARRALLYQNMAIFRDMAVALGETLPAGDLLRRARHAAERAVMLDPTSASTRLALGMLLFRADWDWAGAEREIRQAMRLNPTSPESYRAYSRFLRSMGRFDEARRMLDSAVKYDVAGESHLSRGRIFYFAGDFENAVIESLKDSPSSQRTWYVWTAQAHFGAGQYAKAESLLVRADPNSDAGLPLTRALLYAATGRRGNALAILREVRGTRADLPTTRARVQLQLGDTIGAVASIREAVRDHDPLVVDLKVDPLLQPLRQNAEFQRIVASLRFPISVQPSRTPATSQPR